MLCLIGNYAFIIVSVNFAIFHFVANFFLLFQPFFFFFGSKMLITLGHQGKIQTLRTLKLIQFGGLLRQRSQNHKYCTQLDLLEEAL